jgi:hypothetical protein
MRRVFGWLAAVVCVVVAATGNVSKAAVFTIPASDSGWFDATGEHISGNQNYAVGNVIGVGAPNTRNFFVFDLSSVTGTIVSANLNLRNPINGQLGPARTFTLFDVSTPIASLGVSHVGAPGIAIYNDLGAGTVLGANAGPFPAGGVVTTALNASGLSYLQGALGGTVALGGNYVGAAGGNIYLFGFTAGVGSTPRELVITTSSTVPEPATLATFATLLGAGLALARRRRS